jgi:hypothetical protein
MPYLSYAPSAWVLPLKFSGGGLNAPGKIMFDGEGNAWTGVNFIVGSQASDDLWDGNLRRSRAGVTMTTLGGSLY